MKRNGESSTESGSQSSSIWDTLVKEYDRSQKSRVSRIKNMERENFRDGLPDNEGEVSEIIPPTRAQKIGRALLDRLGIKLKRVESRREEEAVLEARRALLEEYESSRANEEELERTLAEERKRKKEIEHIEEIERAQRRREEQAQREREALEGDMGEARDYFDSHRDDVLRKQRAQELLERGLNEKLLSVDQLDEEVHAGNPDVEKSLVSYGDAEVPVYTLHGMPIRILTHSVDYRQANDPGEIGTETYKEVMEDPKVWDTRRDIAEQTAGFGTRNSDARGDTISTSYTNSEHNFDRRVQHELTYGFSRVEADSVILVENKDAGTSNMAGTAEADISDPDKIDVLDGVLNANSYNEILLRRYSENGKPKRPDYIVAENGRITETVLKHAAYFGIPIVNLDMKGYERRQIERGEKILDSLSEEDSYPEINRKIEELKSMHVFVRDYLGRKEALERIGLAKQSVGPEPDPNSLEGRCAKAEKIEVEKRIDYLVETLQKYTVEIREATARGERISQVPPGFENLRIFFYPHDDNHFCDYLSITMCLSGGARERIFHVIDGDHWHNVDLALGGGAISRSEIERSNSRDYDRLLPIVKEYLAAVRENGHYVSKDELEMITERLKSN